MYAACYVHMSAAAMSLLQWLWLQLLKTAAVSVLHAKYQVLASQL